MRLPSAVAMALFITLTARRASAFTPARSFAARPYATTRRKRPAFSGDAGRARIEAVQRTHGLMKDFSYGHFVQASDTTETARVNGSDHDMLVDLPQAFPMTGRNPDEQPPRMRFAPSPTGSLHVGGARTALYNWLVAKKGQLDAPTSNAAFVLRIEDTDVARSTKESEQSVLADLKWLGLHWDEGPDMPPGTTSSPYGPYRQSERSAVYLAAAQRLLHEGKAYRCFCTNEELEEMKQEQEARGETPRYDGRWRDADPAVVNKMLDQGAEYTIRFKVPASARVVIDDIVRGTVAWDAQATVGDFILLRSSGVPVYNFCVAVDDASMGITTVVRAEEHLTNTVRQALVLDALNAPRPRYAHCSLILGEDKQKLSKRHGATSCDQYRLDGFLPDAMINYLALLGWNDGSDNEIFSRDELIEAFELRRVVKSPSVFDIEKLRWVNKQHMAMLKVEDLVPMVVDQLQWQGLLQPDTDLTDARVRDVSYATTALAKQMMDTTKDAAVNAQTVLGYHLPATFADMPAGNAKDMIEDGNFYTLATKIVAQYESGELPTPDASNPLAAFQDATGRAIEEDSQKGALCSYTDNYMAHMKALAKETGVKGRHLFHPVRLALTGEMSGQDVTKQLSLLALATIDDSVVASEHVVSLADRIQRLKAFCDTIPDEYREPRKAGESKKSKADSMDGSAAQTKTDAAQQSKTSAPSVADPKERYDGPPISALDIRVGRITKVWEHEEADKLYCEEIDVGEDAPRMIASGLRPYLQPIDLQDRLVMVLCNLKERKLLGFPSHGMVLCAANADHSQVHLVSPPVGAQVGERVTVPDFDFEGVDGEPYAENKIGKKKIIEQLAPHLVTDQYGSAQFLGRPFLTSAGICTSPIPNGSVS